MEFNLENEGTWFYFDEDDESKGAVKVKLATAEDMESIMKITHKTKTEFKKGNRFEYQKVDDKLFKKLLFDHCIVDWKNVEAAGEVLECTKENKIMLINKSIYFDNFISKCLEELEEAETSGADAKLKN